jgi:uncharacterized membrane protein SirB2
MALIDHYAAIRQTHVGLVALSLGMFALRGLGVLLGAAWPLHAGPRVAVVVVDTALLIAGSLLWVMLRLNPGRDTWLGVKLGLLVVYVLLGTWALRRGRSTASRAAFYLAALACAATMVAVALAHRPPWAW